MYNFRFYSVTFFYMNQQEILTIPRDSSMNYSYFSFPVEFGYGDGLVISVIMYLAKNDGSRSLLKICLYIFPQSSFLNYTTEGS